MKLSSQVPARRAGFSRGRAGSSDRQQMPDLIFGNRLAQTKSCSRIRMPLMQTPIGTHQNGNRNSFESFEVFHLRDELGSVKNGKKPIRDYNGKEPIEDDQVGLVIVRNLSESGKTILVHGQTAWAAVLPEGNPKLLYTIDIVRHQRNFCQTHNRHDLRENTPHRAISLTRGTGAGLPGRYGNQRRVRAT